LPKYGGCGGNGGSVYFQAVAQSGKRKRKKADEEVVSLYQLFRDQFKGDPKNQVVKAIKGQDASNYKIVGAVGEDVTLKVPAGVFVNDSDGKVLAHLDQDGDRFMVCLGGCGGTPINGFAGQPGQRRHIRLDYKLIADCGLVGFPNAGKSTLLKAISRANPKIASYPFTTIKPNLGQLIYPDQREIKMADLPGLIEGAHYNVGMGHQFLRHVERTSMLVFVIDVNGFKLHETSTFRTAFETVSLLNRELELYNPDLLAKPAVCLVNKMDVDGSEDKLAELKDLLYKSKEDSEVGLHRLEEDQKPEKRINFMDIVPMSAKYSQKTVTVVKDRLRTLLDESNDSSTQMAVSEMSMKLDSMLTDAPH